MVTPPCVLGCFDRSGLVAGWLSRGLARGWPTQAEARASVLLGGPKDVDVGPAVSPWLPEGVPPFGVGLKGNQKERHHCLGSSF